MDYSFSKYYIYDIQHDKWDPRISQISEIHIINNLSKLSTNVNKFQLYAYFESTTNLIYLLYPINGVIYTNDKKCYNYSSILSSFSTIKKNSIANTIGISKFKEKWVYLRNVKHIYSDFITSTTQQPITVAMAKRNSQSEILPPILTDTSISQNNLNSNQTSTSSNSDNDKLDSVESKSNTEDEDDDINSNKHNTQNKRPKPNNGVNKIPKK